MEVWIRQSMAYHWREDSPTPFPVPGWMWDRGRGEQLYTDRMHFIRHVDELGFDGIIFTEHHYGPNGGLTPSPLIALAAATQVTSHIKLATMGIALALYPHPIRVAEELAMIDNLSHGRLVVGFISSGGQSLYAYNVPVEGERERYHEAYDLIVKSWTEENPFEWHGDHFDYRCVSILPRPLQTPHPPVWTTATSAESLQWAAEHHIGLISHGPTTECAERLDYYRDHAKSSGGWTPAPADTGIAREFYIGPTKAAVEEMVEKVFRTDRENAYSFIFEAPNLAELERERYTHRTYDYLTSGKAFRGSDATAHGRETGQFLIGDPDSLLEQIKHQQQTTGAGVLVIRPELGNMPLSEVEDGLTLFAREVLPTVHKW
jgi:alkanesulfonate monooxygenase SsuD/methylene tetrahydromethanopterin reductase-like flavin-dependent oxidoreductase (luciferase family)